MSTEHTYLLPSQNGVWYFAALIQPLKSCDIIISKNGMVDIATLLQLCFNIDLNNRTYLFSLVRLHPMYRNGIVHWVQGHLHSGYREN